MTLGAKKARAILHGGHGVPTLQITSGCLNHQNNTIDGPLALQLGNQDSPSTSRTQKNYDE